MKAGGLDKILGRLEDLDTVNLNILVQRLARERNLQESVFNTIKTASLLSIQMDSYNTPTKPLAP